MERAVDWYRDEATGQYVHHASVMVNAPTDQCFQYWSNYENIPNIMTHVTRVTKTGENTWHWEANVGNRHEEWDAVMSEFQPNELIAWRSISGLKNSGTVRFTPVGMGCRIMVQLMYDPPYGMIGDMVAERGMNDEFHAHLVQDLLNFKHAVESGQVEGFRRAA